MEEKKCFENNRIEAKKKKKKKNGDSERDR